MNLKRCPFCGSEAELESYYGKYGWFTAVKCVVCGAQSKTFNFGRGDLPEGWAGSRPARNAVNAWNMRWSDAEQDS